MLRRGEIEQSGLLAPARHTVILVHGLWTPAAVLVVQEWWLQRRGYRTRRFAYPSVRTTLSQNVAALARVVHATEASRIDLVGHSIGGLIILALLANAHRDERLRRAVLLGTPCRGSHCASRLASLPALPLLLGRSIMEWLADERLLLAAVPAGVDIGVIAGTRSVGLGCVVPGLPQPNDGVVSVAEARLPAATDFITLPVAHSQMLFSRQCARQIAAFLEDACFLRDAA